MKAFKCILNFIFSSAPLLLLFSNSLHAQMHYGFENFSTDQGLSNGWVQSIIQDAKGFLWIGTGSNLDRFDGYSFKRYLNHAVVSLYQNKSREIFAVSDLGLDIFNPDTETSISFLKQIDSLHISRRMRSVIEDKDGNYWIATQTYHDNIGGLVFFDKATRQFKRFN